MGRCFKEMIDEVKYIRTGEIISSFGIRKMNEQYGNLFLLKQ